MQSQMEAKLATLKSPGLKSGLPASPTARNFLSPDSAALAPSDPAATLAQQRAKFKASNAAHRISAPVLASAGAENRATWGSVGGSQLGQVAEQNGGAQEVVVNSARPKSTEFSGTIGSPRGAPPSATTNEVTVPNGEGSWASMVNTPLIPMFQKETRTNPSLDAAASKLAEWSATKAAAPGVPRMGDPTIHRRNKNNNDDDNSGHYQGNRMRNANFGAGAPGAGWSGVGARSPALSNTSSNRLDEHSLANAMAGLNGLGMQMGGFGGMGMGSPGVGGMGMQNLGMSPIAPFNMQMLTAMGISPEAQLLAAQMAANGFGQPGWMGMQGGPGSAGVNSRRGPPSGRSVKSPGSTIGGGTPKGEEDVDPQLLNDVPAWLRSLRLHKYTPNFEHMKWQDMVMLDEAQLEAKGVAALGARRKMLKTFELVRKKMGIEGGPPSSPAIAAPALKSA